MADLSTSYLGLKLKNPVIVSSSDLTRNISGIMRSEQAGAAAVVLKSIFEEQFVLEGEPPGSGYPLHPEALDYLRSGGLLDYAPGEFCQLISEAKKQVKIPVIASINCQNAKLWPRFARQVEDAGADALELNIYVLPIDLFEPGSKYEELHLQILSEVKKVVSLPVAVKLNPQLTSLPNLGRRLADAGCGGLVFFNWFLEPEIDVDKLKTKNLKGAGNLSNSLRWVALLSGRVGCDIAASGGVRAAEDVIKLILAGASAAQVCSVLIQKGWGEIKKIVKGLEDWMETRRYESLEDFKGELSFKRQELSFRDLGEAGAFFRAQYLKVYS